MLPASRPWWLLAAPGGSGSPDISLLSHELLLTLSIIFRPSRARRSYAAPEQQDGPGQYGAEVDVYPLGLILLELAVPFATGESLPWLATSALHPLQIGMQHGLAPTMLP